MGKSYYLHKDNKSGEILYLEYEKLKGYPITPKVKVEDAISVTKIVFINHSLREKLIRKKIDIKLRYLFQILATSDDSSDAGSIQRCIMDAERLRVNILNRYVHEIGNSYASYALSKIQLIINQLKIKFYRLDMKHKWEKLNFDRYSNLYYLDDDEVKKGRGR